MGVGDQLCPWEGDSKPIVQQAMWASGVPVWTDMYKISPPPGFEPWTIQPIVCQYTDYAILTTYL